MSITLGIPAEQTPGERRVAIDPATAGRLADNGCEILVTAGAGRLAGHPDALWTNCEFVPDNLMLAARTRILASVRRPDAATLQALPEGALVIGMLAPHIEPESLKAAAARGLSLISLELLPRITRAQSMDVLSSQATVAGYQSVIIGADLAPRLLPMLTTAAGTLRPARAVVIGAGVAGLMAIATARRLGARVEAYDIRAAAREQVESLGAKMIDTGVDAETAGGYARELTDQEKQQQADALAEHLAQADLVISTAAIPGRPAPTIITRAMVEAMQPGSVIVDIAAESGGNCEITQPGKDIDHGGVIVSGPLNLASRAALHASEMYARNIYNLLQLMLRDGDVVIDTDDEVIKGCLLAHGGKIVHERFIDQAAGE